MLQVEFNELYVFPASAGVHDSAGRVLTVSNRACWYSL